MSHVVNVELVDESAALQAGRDGTGGATRAELFRKAALGGGAFLGGGLLITGLPSLAEAQGRGDVAILNFALLLEELEAAFYADALARGALTGEVLAFATVVGAHEATHVETLRSTLGTAAIPRPTFAFRDVTAAPAPFQATAVILEDTGVSAYNGQGPNISDSDVLAAAASIVSVEARHAAWIRRLTFGPGYTGGRSNYPAPAILDTPLTRRQVETAVGQTGFIAS
jgi:hypothetical protein